VRTRAAEVLRVPTGAPPADAAAAFLAALPAAGFVPDAEAVAAVNVLAGTAAPVEDDAAPGLSVRDAVDGFARRFWSLDPAARTAEWTALRLWAASHPAASRLLDLEPGLSVTADPLPDPIAEEVAAVFRELFVLPPRERAVRRNEWLLANAHRHVILVCAAASLRERNPALWNLEPVLAGRLKLDFKAAEFAAAAHAEPLLRMPAVSQPEGQNAAPTLATGQGTPKSSPSGLNKWLAAWLLLVAVAVGYIVRLIALVPPPAKPKPSDSFHPAHHEYRLPPDSGDRFGYTAVRVEAFRAYEASRAGPAPSRYADWVLHGKPAAHEPLPQGSRTGTLPTKLSPQPSPEPQP
jgi:hypothetical protein